MEMDDNALPTFDGPFDFSERADGYMVGFGSDLPSDDVPASD